MKRILSILLVLTLLLSGAAIAEGASNEVDFAAWGITLPIVPEGEKVTLKIAVPQSAENYDADKVWFWKWASEAMNISFDIEQIPSESVDQRKNLMFASGELPDIINWDWRAYGADKAMDNKYIIALNDVIDKYAPNLKSLIASDGDLEKMLKTDNGSFYAFPFLRGDDELCTYSGPIVRKDWLDKIGMDIPETVDEWETMLRKFKTELNVETPLTCTSAAFKDGFISGAFDAPYCFYIDDNGKAKYGPIEPGFKDFLVTMNKWFNEGLLDKNVATVTDTGALILNERAGATFGFVGGGIGTFLENMQKTN